MEKNKSFLNEHSIRKTKKQKTSFIQHLCAFVSSKGYVSEIEQTKSGSRNVVVGNFADAQVIYTAHYDTPSRSLIPTVITPKLPILSSLSKIAVALAVLLPAFAVFLLLASLLPAAGILPTVSVLIAIIAAIAAFVTLMMLFVAGVAREDNENFNTSGLLALLEIMDKTPEAIRNKVAFVFLDNQENGYIGAKDFAKKHKHYIGKKFIINIDAIGLGEDIVVAVNAGAKKSLDAINSAFVSTKSVNVTVLQGGKHIPSDHLKFKHAVGVMAFKKAPSGMLYLNKLTTAGDTEYNSNNIEYVSTAAINLAGALVGIAAELPFAEAPEEIAEAAEATEAPEEATEAPEEAIEVPEEATEAPEEATDAPEEATEAPEEATEAPEETAEAAEEPAEASAEGAEEVIPEENLE